MQCEMQIKIETTVTRVSCLKRSSYVHIFYLIIQFFWDYHNILLHAHRNDTIWLNVQLLCFLSGIRFLINNVLIICLFNSKLTVVYNVLADIATWLIDWLIDWLTVWFWQVILATNIAESSITVPDIKYGINYNDLLWLTYSSAAQR